MGDKEIGVSKKPNVAGGYEIDSKFFEPFFDTSGAQVLTEDLLSNAAGYS
jgi:hypothetical protein